MTSILRLVEASQPISRAEASAPVLSVAAAVDAFRAADSRLVAVYAQADDLRRVGKDDAAERLEAGAVAEAHEAREVAERAIFAAPVRSLEDLAMKIVVAAEADFECGETNEALLRDAEAILRAARLSV
ncbi:MAG: hypothetical protein ACN6IW_00545 [Paracoccaceae bacterium]